MELLAPAGDLEKLEVAYRYGADAAYLGLGQFSLRQRADNVEPEGPELARELTRIKAGKRLYGTLNIYFREKDLAQLESSLESIALLPLDGIIVSDPGVIKRVREVMPDIELHLSTQANCTNAEAAKVFRDLGFSRIVPARELSLGEIESMKKAVPDVELELFVHGAMCLAYSGRCLLSAWMSGRSGNRGDCAHSCRWNYRVAIEEKQRPGEYLPVEEGPGFSTILSPKDLCMIDHLDAMRSAGADSLKIEGRVKSAYYVAMVTRAYRKEIDRLRSNGDRTPVQPFLDELYQVSHREFSTGFYLGDPDAAVPGRDGYSQPYRFMGTVGAPAGGGTFELGIKNGFTTTSAIEFVGPDVAHAVDTAFELFDTNGNPTETVTHHSGGMIKPSVPVEPGFLIRRRKNE